MNNIHSFSVGAFTCILFRDLLFEYQAEHYFLDVEESLIAQSLKTFQQSPTLIKSPFVSLLLQNGEQSILIDTGVGFNKRPLVFQGREVDFCGKLFRIFNEMDLDSNSITHVVLTHFHPDHIGGICDEHGNIQFPNAQFIAHTDEWDFWNGSEAETLPPLFNQFITDNILPLSGANLHLMSEKEAQILPGIHAIQIPGHTPGQIALRIESQGEKLLFISDAWLHPLHIEHLDWRTSYDMYHEEAKQSRIKLLELAYAEDMLVQSFHFDFPGLGRVDRTTGGWNWISEKL
ncbi:MAG: MBL fold metallo-hydrolase [Saprospiraceae bacterium]|nr:MBL fold metallo-hydrolase [Saprospiraceae bacterium]